MLAAHTLSPFTWDPSPAGEGSSLSRAREMAGLSTAGLSMLLLSVRLSLSLVTLNQHQ